jgi:DNA-binding beta-propeller fold protein YncE/DNA-directed RNA polymerase subunit RPC12/RpoP
MSHAFNCPNCGAPLDYEGNDPIIRCPYCKTSVIVPENLRARPSFSSKPGNFTLSGVGDMGGLVQQAQRINEVKTLAESGRINEAVALFREITGSDEFSARQAVGRLASGQPVTLAGTGIDPFMSHQVGMAPSVGVPIGPRNMQNLGKTMGCTFVFVTLIVLVTIIIPFGLALVGAFTGNDIEDLFSLPFGGGFASREMTFGGEGSGPGKFEDSRAIAVVPDGDRIYVANFGDGRVQVFDGEGNYETQWIIAAETTDPYFNTMAVSRDGEVYIPVYGRIMKFDSRGAPLGEIRNSDYHFRHVAIALDGSLVTIANNEDIVWLSTDGQIRQVAEKAISTVTGRSETSASLAVDAFGRVYLLGTSNQTVFIFGPDGRYINRFGGTGDGPGQFRAASVIAVDPQGRVYVSASGGVQVFSNDGRYLNVINVRTHAYGMAFDDQNNMYATTNQKTVEKYRIRD